MHIRTFVIAAVLLGFVTSCGVLVQMVWGCQKNIEDLSNSLRQVIERVDTLSLNNDSKTRKLDTHLELESRLQRLERLAQLKETQPAELGHSTSSSIVDKIADDAMRGFISKSDLTAEELSAYKDADLLFRCESGDVAMLKMPSIQDKPASLEIAKDWLLTRLDIVALQELITAKAMADGDFEVFTDGQTAWKESKARLPEKWAFERNLDKGEFYLVHINNEELERLISIEEQIKQDLKNLGHPSKGWTMQIPMNQ